MKKLLFLVMLFPLLAYGQTSKASRDCRLGLENTNWDVDNGIITPDTRELLRDKEWVLVDSGANWIFSYNISGGGDTSYVSYTVHVSLKNKVTGVTVSEREDSGWNVFLFNHSAGNIETTVNESIAGIIRDLIDDMPGC